MFKALREKTKQRLTEATERAAELKDKAKQRFNDASQKGRKLRENVEVFTAARRRDLAPFQEQLWTPKHCEKRLRRLDPSRTS